MLHDLLRNKKEVNWWSNTGVRALNRKYINADFPLHTEFCVEDSTQVSTERCPESGIAFLQQNRGRRFATWNRKNCSIRENSGPLHPGVAGFHTAQVNRSAAGSVSQTSTTAI